jgi:predicted RNA-binding Zn-ribbon protein involved in translation (DUF1610 family)
VKDEPKKKSVKEEQEKSTINSELSSEGLENASCPICLETLVDLKKKGTRLRSTNCGHVICKPCCDSLIRLNARNASFECPNCRKALNSRAKFMTFLFDM